MRERFKLGLVLLALILVVGCAPADTGDSVEAEAVAEAPPPAASEEPAAEEPSAEEVLRRMSDYFASMDGFRIRATIEADDVPEPGIKVEYEADLEMAFARPDRLRVDYRDDDVSKTLWIGDGEATLFDPNPGVYSTALAEGDVVATLEVLAERYDIGIPLDDLLTSDPYEVMSAGVGRRRYLGVHQAGGVPCHHAIFDSGDITWQIWVETGETPRLRKVVITETDEPEAPRYSIEIESLEAGAPDVAAFRVEMPEDAALVPFQEVTMEDGP